MKHKKRDKVSKKISVLRREGVPQEQSVATALNMERKGRLTEGGGYKRVHRKSKKRSSKH